MPFWSVMVRLLMMSTKFEYFEIFVRKIFGRFLVSLFVSWVPFTLALLTHMSCAVRSHFAFVFRSCALGVACSSCVQRSHFRISFVLGIAESYPIIQNCRGLVVSCQCLNNVGCRFKSQKLFFFISVSVPACHWQYSNRYQYELVPLKGALTRLAPSTSDWKREFLPNLDGGNIWRAVVVCFVIHSFFPFRW